jgi:hypothetical protein
MASKQAGHFHAVRFYENRESLARTVADFLSEGLSGNQPGLVIATPEHRDGILAELRNRGLDVDPLVDGNSLTLLDAAETLNQFMIDGTPDPALFRAAMIPVIDRLCENRKPCTVRAYGEMVDVLWKQGRTTAAVRLEILWNELAGSRDFSLLCGYAVGSFYKNTGMKEVCEQHSHVIQANTTLSAASGESIH